MNIKALERVFLKEVSRLLGSVKRENSYKPARTQINESIERLEADYKKETQEDLSVKKSEKLSNDEAAT